ncbi:MAG: hypothetical protein JW910_02995 [Anaerolineae bacterium]|nr:hypothetical protein [Anaerolineae bacterium]
MAKKRRKTRLGKLPPQHTFFLNPYSDARFTRCPSCEQPMKQRKRPFLIHIDPQVLLTLNMTGRYCPACDLIILHQDVLEDLLVRAFEQKMPEIVGNNYLVIGTVERAAWRAAQKKALDYETLFANLHDFKQVVIYEPRRWVWMPDPDSKKERE